MNLSANTQRNRAVYALYNCDKRIGFLMGVFLLSEIGALCATVLQNASEMYFTPRCHTLLEPGLIIPYACVLSTCTVIAMLMFHDFTDPQTQSLCSLLYLAFC